MATVTGKGEASPSVAKIDAHEEWPDIGTLSLADFYDFYHRLTELLLPYHIGLTRFESINLSFHHRGLCIPGMGLKRFAAQGRALFRVLTAAISHDTATFRVHFKAEERAGKDGFGLLWNIGFDIVGVFDKTRTVYEPSWPADNDVYTLQNNV